METLIKAKDLHENIDLLAEEIDILKGHMKKVMAEKSPVGIKFDFEKKESSSHLESEMKMYLNGKIFSAEDDPFTPELILEDSEFMVVIGTLINFKTAKRKELINQFNQLNIKLKL